MNPKEFKLPSDFDGKVRLFPLPDLVFFPHNVQPLHIFESRYVEMLDQAINTDRLIAMATLEPGFESDYYGRPSIAPVVCIGEVAMHKRTDNGTYNLALVGINRARIVEELSPNRAYREAKVTVIQDFQAVDSPNLRRNGDALARLMKRRVPETAKLTREFLNGRIDLATYTDVISFRLPVDIETKLSLLTEPDPGARAQILMNHLDDVPVESGKRPFPPEFSEN